jgi:aminodeoxyfutalosine synthase
LQKLENLRISDKNLFKILEKVEENIPLTLEEGIYLYKTEDFYGLIGIANYLTEKKHGYKRFFSVNKHINPTNYCINRCKFCAFSKKWEDKDGYALEIKEIVKLVEEAVENGVREIHIVSGLHPEWPYEYYVEIIKTIRWNFPFLTIKAYTAVEIDHLAKIGKKSVREVLTDLKNAGLDAMPGGGAEVFGKRIRSKICPEKISGERWLEIHKVAHELGIKTNCTLLYGHIEEIEDRIDHLIRIRELQSETGGFQSFIPLRYQKTEKIKVTRETYGIDDIRTIAVSRLMLHNVPHIKAYWVMLGENIAQFALIAGASEIEGTVYGERIAHSAGTSSPDYLTKDRIIKLIKDIGKIPVERDGLYRELGVYR